jgi:hypothetical protein
MQKNKHSVMLSVGNKEAEIVDQDEIWVLDVMIDAVAVCDHQGHVEIHEAADNVVKVEKADLISQQAASCPTRNGFKVTRFSRSEVLMPQSLQILNLNYGSI